MQASIFEKNILNKKHVVIIGAGFGGLQAVKKLSKEKCLNVTLIDKKNHHLFQPLLYQVATAVLSPADIAIPTRSLMHRKKNVTILMDEVTSIDIKNKIIVLEDKEISYDYLILAAGARTGYFGKTDYMKYTYGLKNLQDALRIRNKILTSFEEAENHPENAEKLLKFIIIGGGPTGVELAGSIAELSNHIIREEFRNIDTSKADIKLIEASSDLLATFNRELSVYTKLRLEKRNVRVILNTRVIKIEPNKVFVKGIEGENEFEASLIIWTAGVEAVPLTIDTGLPVGRNNRLKVNRYCSFDNHPEIFAIGDIAEFSEGGKILPGVSAVAMQEGRYAARAIIDEIKGREKKPFIYFDKGNMATIGRKDAVAELGGFKLTGFMGWLMWLFVHLFYQVGFKNKISILITWIWSYITFGAAARVIQEPLTEKDLKI
ncbi:MAG: Demethylphylloquinone reductase NdbB [Ignavibacteria bacterium]|nr:Demethylphylloquinone reductase NdbB [Ignavibacteria bacterium]